MQLQLDLRVSHRRYKRNGRTASTTLKAELLKAAHTSVGRLGGVGLGVAPPPPHPALQLEGAALVVEPSPLLEGAEQLVQGLREVRS